MEHASKTFEIGREQLERDRSFLKFSHRTHWDFSTGFFYFFIFSIFLFLKNNKQIL